MTTEIVKQRLKELEAQDEGLAKDLCESFGWNGETVTSDFCGPCETPIEWFAQVLWEAIEEDEREELDD